MAQKLLLNALVEHLGSYVEGLHEENLKLGVFSGKIELNNLVMKDSALDNIDLPIKVIRGTLKTLKIKVPWTKLQSEPVKVVIDGVYLLAGPLDSSKFDADDLQEAMNKIKLQKLKAVEDGMLAAMKGAEGVHEKTKNTSYLQQLATKIIDNIEVTISNVHIRYEDAISIPGSIFAAGVTLASISLSTADENWKVSFVSRDGPVADKTAAKPQTCIHKIGAMDNFSVYWSTVTEPTTQLKQDVWEKNMLSTINAWETAASSSSARPALQYILASPNRLSVKITHNEEANETTPKLDCVVECTTLPFTADKLQLQQVVRLGQSLSILERQKQMALYRPKRRPSQDPRAWWKYAYNLVTGKDLSIASKVATMIMCVKAKPIYVEYMKKKLAMVQQNMIDAVTSDLNVAAPMILPPPPHILDMEHFLPLPALISFKQIAISDTMVSFQKAMKLAAEKRAAAEAAYRSSALGRMGALFGGGGGGGGGGTAAAAATTTSLSPSSTLKAAEENPKPKKKSMFSFFGSGKEKDANHHSNDKNTGAGALKDTGAVAAASSLTGKGAAAGGGGGGVSNMMSPDYDATEDQKLLQEIEDKLAIDVDPMAAAAGQLFTLRLAVKSSASLKLSTAGRPLIVGEFAVRSAVEIKLDNLRVHTELSNIFIEDQYTVKPLNKFLVQMMPNADGLSLSAIQDGTGTKKEDRIIGVDADSKSAQFVIDFQKLATESSIHVASSMPSEIVWNDSCIRELLDFVNLTAGDGNGRSANVKNNSNSGSGGGSGAIDKRSGDNKNSVSDSEQKLVASLNRFAAEVNNGAANRQGKTHVSISIHAPKFVFPDCCYVDNGCMLVDCGKLMVTGMMDGAVGGMEWGVNLSSINIAMPQSMTTEATSASRSSLPPPRTASSSSSENLDLYLIKPFDLSITVQDIEKSTADMSINVAFSPSISAQFDATKIARLLGITDMVLASLRPGGGGGDDADGTNDNNTGDTELSLLGDNEDAFQQQQQQHHVLLLNRGNNNNKVHDAAGDAVAATKMAVYAEHKRQRAGAAGAAGALDPRRNRVLVKVQLPVASVSLLISKTHHIDYAINNVSASVASRLYDVEIGFRVTSMQVKDSTRVTESLLWTPVNDHSHHQLFSVLFRNINSRKSPHYNGFKSELAVEIAKICLSIDEKAILGLSVFLGDLGEQMLNVSEVKDEHLLHSAVSLAGSEAAAAAASAAASASAAVLSDRLGSRRTESSSGQNSQNRPSRSPSFNAFQSQRPRASSISPTVPSYGSDANKQRGVRGSHVTFSIDCISLYLMHSVGGGDIAANEEQQQQQNVSENHDSTNTGTRALERAFCVEVSRFGAELALLDTTELSAWLRSFNVSDTRSERCFYSYNTLICRREIVSEAHTLASPRNKNGTSSTAAAAAATAAAGDSDDDDDDEYASAGGDATWKKETAATVGNGDAAANPSSADILTFKCTVDKPNTNVEIRIRDVTSYVSLDILLYFVELIMQNVNAGNALVAVLNANQVLKAANERNKKYMGMKFRAGIDKSIAYISNSGAAPIAMVRINEEVDSDDDDEDGEDGEEERRESEDQGTHKVKNNNLAGSSSSLVVALFVDNPKLLFLENPEIVNTKAIAGHCNISLHYCKEIKIDNNNSGSDKESIHLAVDQAEVFVLTDMKAGTSPHRMIEPTGLDCHIMRQSENGRVLVNKLVFHNRSLSMRVSLNDIVLSMRILDRARLVKTVADARRAAAEKLTLDAKGFVSAEDTVFLTDKVDSAAAAAAANEPLLYDDGDDSSTVYDGDDSTAHSFSGDLEDSGAVDSQANLTMFSANVHLEQVSMVLVNDFENLNVPIIRFVVDNAEFECSGVTFEIYGEGSTTLQADYFNESCSVWEPLLETWQPAITLTKTTTNGITLEVKNPNILQLNVSGVMTKCIANCRALVSRIGEEGSYGHRDFHPLVVKNLLGVPVKISESQTGAELMVLRDGSPVDMPTLASIAGREGRGGENKVTIKPGGSSGNLMHQHWSSYPDRFDLSFVDEQLAKERKPLRSLPLHSRSPRQYTMQFNRSEAEVLAEASHGTGKLLHGRPVVEEIYENQRYTPLRGKWSEPWPSMGDPNQWSDIRGNGNKPPESVFLPDGWMWVEDKWTVDLGSVRAAVGHQADKDGWEYGNTFGGLAAANVPSRSQAPLDVVRRRRWVRTRKPTASLKSSSGGAHSELQQKPISIIWDVETLPDGSRVIAIKSGVQIQNYTNIDLEFELSEFASFDNTASQKLVDQKALTSQHMGHVSSGSLHSLPLNQADIASFVRFRPAGFTFDWSVGVNCSFKSDNLASNVFSDSFEVHCRGLDFAVFHMIVNVHQTDKALMVSCSPVAVIQNRLLCDIHFRAHPEDQTGQIYSESATVAPGESQPITKVNFHSASHSVHLAVAIGPYSSPAPLLINCDRPEGVTYDTIFLEAPLMDPQSAKRGEGNYLSFTLREEMTGLGVLELTLYSKFALIDKSNSALSVRSKCKKIVTGVMSSGGSGKSIMSNSSNSSTGSGSGSSSGGAAHFDIMEGKPVERRSFSKDYGAPKNLPGQYITVENIKDAWSYGANGLTLFETYFEKKSKNKISIGVNEGAGWCDDLSTVSVSSTDKSVMEIVDQTTKRAYNLAYTIAPMEGAFGGTQVLTVFPCFTIINYLDESLTVMQECVTSSSSSKNRNSNMFGAGFGKSDSEFSPHHQLVIDSKGSSAWHKTDTTSSSRNTSPTAVRFRTAGTYWSFGSVDLNEIGTSLIILPNNNNSNAGSGYGSSDPNDMTILHVEVRLSDPSDNSYLTIVVWRSRMMCAKNQLFLQNQVRQYKRQQQIAPASLPKVRPQLIAQPCGLSVRNETDFTFVVEQSGVAEDISLDIKSKFNLSLPAQQWLPYGWMDPNKNWNLKLTLGATKLEQTAANNLSVVVDMLTIGVRQTVDVTHLMAVGGTGAGGSSNARGGKDGTAAAAAAKRLVFVVKTVGDGRVLHIFEDRGRGDEFKRGSSKNRRSANNRRHGQKNGGRDFKSIQNTESRSTDVTFKLNLAAIGVSLVAERPYRREFLSVYVTKLITYVRKSPETETEGATLGLQLQIKDVQIDNYSETAEYNYPVLLNSSQGAEKLRAAKDAARKEAAAAASKGKVATKQQQQQGRRGEGSGGGEEDSSDAVIDDDLCFITFGAVQEIPKGQCTPVMKYIGFRMLEVKLAVDSATLMLFVCELYRDLLIDPASLTVSKPEVFAVNYNEAVDRDLKMLAGQQGMGGNVDLERAYAQALTHKVYFEAVTIHPIRITLTFAATKFPRPISKTLAASKEFQVLGMLQSLTTVEDMEIKIKSFVVSNAMESAGSLTTRIQKKTMRELQSQIIKIAGNLFGSIGLLGKPAGLYKNIGTGVQDFFYEPYLGIMQSPESFLIGISRGTGSLIVGVGGGVVNSVATIVGSASSTLSTGVGVLADDKFNREREERRRELTRASSQRGGGGNSVLSGFVAGGESVAHGFMSGLSGLVTKPLEEGKKGGALGFMKGVGMGLGGVVAKPIVGVTDGIANVATGFSQQISDKEAVLYIRPARAFETLWDGPGGLMTGVGGRNKYGSGSGSDSNNVDKVLLPLDLFAGEAQDFVNKVAKNVGKKDTFRAYVSLGFNNATYNEEVAVRARSSTSAIASASSFSASNRSSAGGVTGELQPYAMVVSDRNVFLLSRECAPLWVVPFGDVSHFVLSKPSDAPQGPNKPAVVVELVGYNSSDSRAMKTQSIPCATRMHALKVYALLSQYSGKMGNPSAVVPLAQITADGGKERKGGSGGTAAVSSSSSSSSSTDQEGTSTVYQFGTCNKSAVTSPSVTSVELVARAAKWFAAIATPVLIDGGHHNDSARYRFAYYKQLDERMWQVISDWRYSHSSLHNKARCECILLLNHSSSYVQILSANLKEGRDMTIFPVGSGYDTDSRSLLPNGGAAVIFAFAAQPSLVDLAHVKVDVATTAFNARFSTRHSGTMSIRDAGGFTTGFLEKSTTDWWCKVVVSIT